MLRLVILQLLALVILAAVPSQIHLHEVAKIKTDGAAGFEHFTEGQSHFLVVPNFWDGIDRNMGADTKVYFTWLSSSGALEMEETQRIRGQGAHGADVFTTQKGTRLLTVPFYYGCGSNRGPALTGAHECASTLVMKWNKVTSRFSETKRLHTAGPAQTNHFMTRDGTSFLLVGENLNDQVCLYRIEERTSSRPGAGASASASDTELEFVKHQCLAVPGSGSMAVAEAGEELVLVASSYHENGWATNSRIFKADARSSGRTLNFMETQLIETQGAHDTEVALVAGELFLFFSEDRSAQGPKVDSSLLIWSAADRKFNLHQRIATDGAHGACLFEGPDRAAYLMIANFGDRLGEKYEASSALWRQTHKGPTGMFEQVSQVTSFGATDAKHFVIDDQHFIALSNEGDLQKRRHQYSKVYQIVVTPTNSTDDNDSVSGDGRKNNEL